MDSKVFQKLKKNIIFEIFNFLDKTVVFNSLKLIKNKRIHYYTKIRLQKDRITFIHNLMQDFFIEQKERRESGLFPEFFNS